MSILNDYTLIDPCDNTFSSYYIFVLPPYIYIVSLYLVSYLMVTLHNEMIGEWWGYRNNLVKKKIKKKGKSFSFYLVICIYVEGTINLMVLTVAEFFFPWEWCVLYK